jgi:hypothetical protein
MSVQNLDNNALAEVIPAAEFRSSRCRYESFLIAARNRLRVAAKPGCAIANNVGATRRATGLPSTDVLLKDGAQGAICGVGVRAGGFGSVIRVSFAVVIAKNPIGPVAVHFLQ